MDNGTISLNNPATDSTFHISEKQLQFILQQIFESAYGNSLSHLSTNVTQDDIDHAPSGNAVYTAIQLAMENAQEEGAAKAKDYVDQVAKELATSITENPGGLKYEIVGTLPPLPADNTIYFKLSEDGTMYTAYIFIGGRWMAVGGDESTTEKKPITDERLDEILLFALE